MSDSRPLVSIVTPSFNQAPFLEQTILSVLNQTYPRIEYLVLDGGSTDASPSIIERHAARLAYWHSRRDRGCSDAIREGFQRSTGEILAYLNSDDVLFEDAVERAVAALTRNQDAVMVYGNRVCIDGDGRLLYSRPNPPWWSRGPFIGMTIGQESAFWRRGAYEKAGGVNAEFQFAFDYDLFSRIGRLGSVTHDGRIWSCFRKHSTSKTTTQYQTVGKREIRRVQDSVWGRPPNRLAWLSVLAMSHLYTVAVTPFVRRPPWPRCLPSIPQPGAWKTFTALLREESLVSQAMRSRAARRALASEQRAVHR